MFASPKQPALALDGVALKVDVCKVGEVRSITTTIQKVLRGRRSRETELCEIVAAEFCYITFGTVISPAFTTNLAANFHAFKGDPP